MTDSRKIFFLQFRLIAILISSAFVLSSCAQKTLTRDSSSADGNELKQYDRYVEGELIGFQYCPVNGFSKRSNI